MHCLLLKLVDAQTNVNLGPYCKLSLITFLKTLYLQMKFKMPLNVLNEAAQNEKVIRMKDQMHTTNSIPGKNVMYTKVCFIWTSDAIT